MADLKTEDLRKAVQEHYAAVAERGKSCCGGGVVEVVGRDGKPIDASRKGAGKSAAGRLYSAEELAAVTDEASAASAGCGNPTALSDLRPGDTVVDLGSGGGIDCFLAARQVGPSGRVVGIDMTPAMVALARENTARLGLENVTFHLAPIEAIPLPDASADVVISNCVIALAPDKSRVFAEAYRVLRPGGRMFISDMALLAPLPEAVAADARQWVSCVAGAELKDVYLGRIADAGFEKVDVLSVAPMPSDKGREWASDVVSISVKAVKPAR